MQNESIERDGQDKIIEEESPNINSDVIQCQEDLLVQKKQWIDTELFHTFNLKQYVYNLRRGECNTK